MYYRNNNFGCFILLLLVLFTMGAFLRLLFTPVFWIVVGIVALISAVQKYLYKRNHEDEYEPEYERSRTYGNSGNRSMIEAQNIWQWQIQTEQRRRKTDGSSRGAMLCSKRSVPARRLTVC